MTSLVPGRARSGVCASSRPLGWLALIVVGCATLAYCLCLGLLSTAWICSVTGDSGAASRLSRFFLQPLGSSPVFGMLHWQLPVVLSLLILVRRLVASRDDVQGLLFHLVAHLGWLLTASLLHGAGFLISTVPLCARIG